MEKSGGAGWPGGVLGRDMAETSDCMRRTTGIIALKMHSRRDLGFKRTEKSALDHDGNQLSFWQKTVILIVFNRVLVTLCEWLLAK
jgi:hypothetical protein